MTTFSAGARQLPTHHVSIRVPWHDDGWRGTVCKRPKANNSCLVLPRISERRNDDEEQKCAGACWEDLDRARLPVCADEHGGFMAPFAVSAQKEHPYADSQKTHGHFAPTPYRYDPYSAAAVPFGWMLKSKVLGDEKVRGLADNLQLGVVPANEPALGFESAWVQERENQLAVLDTFFGAIEPKKSLCFFYAKRTPLSEKPKRVIIGVGKVVSVGSPTEYRYTVPNPPLRCVLWERNVCHSIRPVDGEGFLLPYREVLEQCERDGGIDPEECVAFVSDEYWDQFSYGSELVTHDGAIAALLATARALRKLEGVVPGDWKSQERWLDGELNRLWKMRGPFPGFGSALTAFGIPNGTLVAYEIGRAQAQSGAEWNEDPWPLFEAVLDDPSILPDGVAAGIGDTLRKTWKMLKPERRQLLQLLSRMSLTEIQALRYFQPTERGKAGIEIADRALIENPYLVFELDRRQPDPVALGTVDRGLFPDPIVLQQHPVPAPSALSDGVDARRVRSMVIDTLETAAVEGHTLQPRDMVVQSVRDRDVSPACSLSEDVLVAVEESFPPAIRAVDVASGAGAFQLDYIADAGALISTNIERRAKGHRHPGTHDWRKLIDAALEDALPADAEAREVEERARKEKAAALEELHASRVSVLIGPAGTGKTTLLKALLRLPDVDQKGVLLLAPTGKARVRLETQVGKKGEGRTLAQFLNQLGRYDPATGAYRVTGSAEREKGRKTVVIDEASMLTELQLAAVLDAVEGVERLVLVGDPRQLPPIGEGRPFIDIVRRLVPDDIEARFPKVAPGYTELTVPVRQQGRERHDLLLAHWFSGRPCDAGADEIWEHTPNKTSKFLRTVEWSTPDDLQAKLLEVLVSELALAGQDDEIGFEKRLGGIEGKDGTCWFNAKWNDRAGAAEMAEAWQILSPVRAGQHGVDAINRDVQRRFRKRIIDLAHPKNPGWAKIMKPLGAHGIVYGDKVINSINRKRRYTYPKGPGVYVANGDIGIVVGHRRTKKKDWYPATLDVEYASELGTAVHYKAGEFSDEGANPLELAYALTVHKAQGSEFGLTIVVVPNPCWLLSRELLYTALTRQRDRVVLLHQGPLRDLRMYTDDVASDIARRVTNLFAPPRLVSLQRNKRKDFYEAGLIHRTERGELVRSKSELCIADKLHARGVNYSYEAPLRLGEETRFPDFTIEDAASGVNYYWEHLGMLGDPAYRKRWEAKLGLYRRHGIVPHDEGGGPNGTLIRTTDDERGGLDGSKIAALIDGLLR